MERSSKSMICFLGQMTSEVMTHWYSADLHLDHERIIPLCRRPFRSGGEMNSMILQNFWERVRPEDDLWVIGDFAFCEDADRLRDLFGQLPGARRHLVIGNHDGPTTQALPWDSVSHMTEVEDPYADHPVTLCHYPLMTWNGARKGAIHLFGHVHLGAIGWQNALNVGVDMCDFRPITIREAASRARELPQHMHWSEVEHNGT
ncbi:calcineurin-like phosphoesterase family protein [Mesorhizobium sp. J18]|nr:calcineurin-like phosphoesterase family protein [Mesorhizobium sp. J18]